MENKSNQIPSVSEADVYKNPNLLEELKQELSKRNLIQLEKFDPKLLENYEVIGFDVDHTLECYNMFNFPSLLYSCFSKYLVEYEYYPININVFQEEIEAENKKHDRLNFLTVKNFENYACTEVLLDLETGNALKIAEDLTILKAFHGIKELSLAEIEQIYPEDRKFPKSKNFDYNKSYTENYFYIRGYIEFHISALFIFCVELFNLRYLTNKNSYKEIFADIYKAFNFNYKLNEQSSDCFALSGYYYPEITNKTEFYLNMEVNKNEKLRVRNTLENLRKKGKKLFFATNSFYAYADMVMKISLGEDYKDLFDLGFYFAKKPLFFKVENDGLFGFNRDSRKFNLKDFEENENIYLRMKEEKVVLGGSGKIAERFFEKFFTEENLKNNEVKLDNLNSDKICKKKILYVGDNFSNDCYIPSLNENWEAIAVDESMDTGFIGTRNENLSSKWKMDFEDEIKEYRFKIIRESVKLAVTNVQLLDQFS